MTPRTPLLRQTSTGWLAHAPAKINLYLDVLGRRPDGFHDLETLIAPISLFDTLHLESTKAGDRSITLDVVDCTSRSFGRPEATQLAPANETNLIVRSLRRLQSELDIDAGAKVTLYKRIPIQAGLGGGSSDAAAAILAGQRLWGATLPPTKLNELAAEIGSDVPALLSGSASVCRGRGERVEPTALPSGLACVLAQPPMGLGAGEVFAEFRSPSAGKRGERGRLAKLLSNLRTGRLAQAARQMQNRLQSPAERRMDAIGQNWIRHLRSAFAQLPIAAHQMSGSGSVYFGLCENYKTARRAAAQLRGLSWRGQRLGWVGMAGTI